MVLNQRFIALGVLVFGVLFSLFLFWDALAAVNPFNISFPVPELNNCKDLADCKAFCDKPENAKACLGFAKKHNLLPQEELNKAEKLANIKGGPGGCNSQASCEAYCNNIDRMDECLTFAEEHGFMEKEDLEEAKKVREALKRGAKLPGGCRDRNSCEAYCSDPSKTRECLAFAKEAGFIDKEEVARAEKFIPLMERGETPGGCRSKEACEKYCFEEDHLDECIVFGEKVGAISEKEREIIKKTGGRGPGGCRGRQCEAFCQDPANQKACFEFAKEHGLMKEEDLRRMEQGRQQLKQALGVMPPEVRECVNGILGPGGLEKIESGEFFGGSEIGEQMKACFEKFIPQGFGEFRGGEFRGPGGCTSFEACTAYCQANKDNEQCQKFAPPGFKEGGLPPGFKGPGGCSSIEECTAYCQANPEACEGFGPPGGFPSGFEGGFPGVGVGVSGGFTGIPGIDGLPEDFHPCKSDQECRSYCSSNRSNCGEFWGQGVPGGPGAFSGGPVSLPGGASVSVKKLDTGGYLFKFASSRGMSDFFILPVSDYLSSTRQKPYGGGVYCAKTFQDIETQFSSESFPLRITLGLCGAAKTFGFTVTSGRDFYLSEDQGFSAPSYISNKEVESCILSAPDGSVMLSDWSAGRSLTLETREIVRMCVLRSQGVRNPFEQAAQGIPQPKGERCPGMPTVDRCPEGQIKKQVYSSPECGAYYACFPSGEKLPASGLPPKLPEGFKPPEGFQIPEGFKPPEGFAPPSGGYPSPEDLQKYQQQFQQQYEQQFQQYQQQYQDQYQQYR